VTLDLSSLARLDARVRLAELVAEEGAILRVFPELQGTPGPLADGAGWGRVKPAPRKRPRMSPAQRQAVSERIARYGPQRRNPQLSPECRCQACGARFPLPPNEVQ
jgi:hypothetical protein